MLVGKLSMSTRERLMVTILDKPKGARSIDCRIYRILEDGELMPTTDGITLDPEKVESFVGLLREAAKKTKDKEAGTLPG